MKTILMSSAVVLSMASLAAAAEEMSTSFSWGDVTFQPRAYVGYADFSIEASEFADLTYVGEDGLTKTEKIPWSLAFPDVHKLQINGPVFGIGGTVAVNRFFGDFYYQSTQNEKTGDSSSYQGLPVGPEGHQVLENGQFDDPNLKHSDWALSIGYMITDQWSVFAGYKSGFTKWDQTVQYTYPDFPDFINNSKLTGKFKQDGPFLGTAYSLLIDPGVLTIKAAYAYLDGSDNESLNAIYADGGQDFSEWHLDGNSNAFSVGVSWTQNFTNNLGYSIGANYHRYKFDLSGGISSVEVNGVTTSGGLSNISMTEELFTLTASIIYRF